MLFNLETELAARKRAIAENDLNKQIVADLEAQLAEAKANVRSDSEIADLEADIVQITEYCYRLGIIERPVETVVEAVPEDDAVVGPIV